MMTKQKFNGLLKTIRTSGARFEAAVQEAAIAAMEYAADGNANEAGQLISTLPNGSNRRALIQYLEDFGGVKWNAKEETCKRRGKKGNRAPVYVEEAKEVHWTEYKRPSKSTGGASAPNVDQAAKYLERKAKKAEDNGDHATALALRNGIAAMTTETERKAA